MANQIKRASVKWIDGLHFESETGSGHRIILDSAPRSGVRNHGTSPIELVLVALAGCTAIDVVGILQKEMQNIKGLMERSISFLR